MITVLDIAAVMEEYAPKALAEKWDNVGLLVGSYNSKVNTILIALDADNDIISEAVKMGADLIITHHPIIFNAINSVTDDTVTGMLLQRLIRNNISLYAAHTNLDTAKGGVNDALAHELELSNVVDLCAPGFDGGARMGRVKKQTLGEFAGFVKNTLNSAVIKRVGDASKTIQTVGVCGGSGGYMIESAKQSGCDALVTGEAKYSDEQKAAQLGLCLIEAGHFETENIICREIHKRLSGIFKDLQITISKRKTTYYE
ncbi:MAG: Nif3-like dinuclear metal center hexameric protein [Firmicutes bacterium]|nr:Nif3-like dinuclear metal center hexameric protein [Bacillota bacterium]